MHKVIGYFTPFDKKLRDNRWIFTSMLIGSMLSLLAAFTLSVEAVELAKNPDAKLSCSINVVLNCTTVNSHPTANLFGFPNSFIGLMLEPVVIAIAVAGLAGMRFPRPLMLAAQVGYTLGLVFALSLFYISFVIIQTLCLWCLLVTLTTILVWFAITRYNIREDNLYLPRYIQKRLHEWVERDYDKLIMFGLITALIGAIVIKYGDGLFV